MSKQFRQGRANASALLAFAVMASASLCFAAAPATPASGAASAAMPTGHPSGAMLRKDAVPPTAPVRLVDINSASRKELKTLPGIGDAEADKIIANRPYLTKTELVTKQVLPTGPFLSLRNRVIAMQPIKPKGKS